MCASSPMLAAAYIWANKGLLMVAIVLSLGLGEASTSTRDLLLKLRALRDEGSRCYYLLSKPEFLLHTSVLAALNYAVVHASLKWGHVRGFRFKLGTRVMNLVAKYVAVAIDPKASGLFDDAYAYAKPLGFEHAVDNLAKNYTKELIEYIINRYDYVLCLPWSHSFFFDKDRRAPYARALGRQLWPPAAASTPLRDAVDMVALEGEPGGIVAGGELPSILYEALAKKFCSYKVDNAHSEVMVKILKWVIAEGHTLPGHRDARFGNTASENDVSTYLLEHYPDGSPQLEAARAEARSDVAPKKRPRATREESTSSVEDLVRGLPAAHGPDDGHRFGRHDERRGGGGDDDERAAAAAAKKKAVGMCKCCEKLEIQTPAQGPFATHNAATCPLNPDVGVPKAPGPKKRRADPSAIPYEVGSCTRASNTDKTRGPLFRPGEDAVARRA
ncbi:hypothetical protein JL720_12077 [Aureococcus anophagefferens]|nr:hypothetical protein JL720_12077 [Aureococcus anophagefferens]